MLILFIISSDVAVVATLLAVTARVTLHSLLYLAISLVAVALVFYALGAPFVAALEVIVYAGAIVVLFIFAVMLLSPSESMTGVGALRRSRQWLWPTILGLVLLGEIVYVLTGATGQAGTGSVPSADVGVSLFGPYALGVELAAMLLLVALIGVTHIARQRVRRPDRHDATRTRPVQVVGPEPPEAVGVSGPGVHSKPAIGDDKGAP